MKLCLITGSFPPIVCGVGDYTQNLCKVIAPFCDLSIITSQDVVPNDDLPWKMICSMNQWNFSEIIKLIHLISLEKPDIVHIQYPSIRYRKYLMINFLPFFLRIKNRHWKVITTLHEYSDNGLLGQIRLFPNILFSHEIIVVDEEYQTDIKKIPLFKSTSITCIHNAHNVTSIPDLIEVDRIHQILSSDGKYKLMGFFGFIRVEKGLENILYAMISMKNEGNLLSKLVLLGSFPNSDYANGLRNIISENQLDDYIISTGYLSDNQVANYISAIDFFVYPFVYGVSPKNTSVLVAIAHDKPLITTRRNGKTVIDAHGIYYLNSSSDIREIVNLIDRFQSDMLMYGVDYTSFDLTWDRVGKEHLRLYEKCMGR